MLFPLFPSASLPFSSQGTGSIAEASAGTLRLAKVLESSAEPWPLARQPRKRWERESKEKPFRFRHMYIHYTHYKSKVGCSPCRAWFSCAIDKS